VDLNIKLTFIGRVARTRPANVEIVYFQELEKTPVTQDVTSVDAHSTRSVSHHEVTRVSP
jgi:hypothetical protein